MVKAKRMTISQIIKRAKIGKAKAWVEWFINVSPKEIKTTTGMKVNCRKGLAGLFLPLSGDLGFVWRDNCGVLHMVWADEIDADLTKEQTAKIDDGKCYDVFKGLLGFECSVCRHKEQITVAYNYCPNCGRKVEGKK